MSPKKHTVNSESPTLVKNTLSNSQLSYFARTGVGTTMGDSIVKIVVSGGTTGPSYTTNNLFENDVVCIGGTSLLNGCTTYTVQDIGNTGYFEVDTGLSAMVGQTSSYIIATRSAQHVVSFTPQNNITGGKWQVLLKATSTTPENNQDGMPDQNGFDIGSNVGTQTTGPGARLAASDVTCPWSMTASGIGSTVGVIAANGTTYYYHTIICSLAAGATNPINVGGSIAIGAASAVTGTQIINPSPNRTGTYSSEGNANVYNFVTPTVLVSLSMVILLADKSLLSKPSVSPPPSIHQSLLSLTISVPLTLVLVILAVWVQFLSLPQVVSLLLKYHSVLYN